jgi:heme-degrading monooxygenase HmoA
MSVVISCIEGREVVVDAPGCAVHRAVEPEARFGYVTVGDREPMLGPAAGSVLTGRYEVVHAGDTTAPAYDPAGSAEPPLIFINCMEFARGHEQAAFEFWQRVNEYMVKKPGYRWHRLHRRLHDDAPFGQINIVEWESVESWAAAHDEGFRALTMRPDIPFTPVPTLCRLVSDDPSRVSAEA